MTEARMQRIGTVEGARYALAKHRGRVVKYFDSDDLKDIDFDAYLEHLSSSEAWNTYKTQHGNDNNIFVMDTLINDGYFQESLILQDILIFKKEKIAAIESIDSEIQRVNDQYDADLPFDEWHVLKKQEENLLKQKADILNELIIITENVTPFQPSVGHYPMSSHHHSKIANVMNQGEAAAEVSVAQSELIRAAEEYVKTLENIGKVGAAAIEGGKYSEGVSQAFSTLESILPFVHSVPVFGDYFRGLNYLRECIAAIRDKDVPQRKTKIASGLFGGLVSLCGGTLGALLLGGIAISPFGIAALTVGVYSVALYRDGYILYQARKESQKIKQEIQNIEDKIKDTQDDLEKITLAINKNNHLDKNDPRILYLNLQKNNLEHTLKTYQGEKENLSVTQEKLRKARLIAYKRVAISTACFVAVGLALTALCLSGVGMLAVSVVGAGILISASLYKLHVIRQTNKAEAHKSAVKKPDVHDESRSTLDNRPHNDEVFILGRFKEEAASTNNAGQVDQAPSKNDPSEIDNQAEGNRVANDVTFFHEEEGETEGEGEKRKEEKASEKDKADSPPSKDKGDGKEEKGGTDTKGELPNNKSMKR